MSKDLSIPESVTRNKRRAIWLMKHDKEELAKKQWAFIRPSQFNDSTYKFKNV